MKYEQLPLFFVQPDPRVAVYDPAWDKPINNVGEQSISEASQCFDVGEQVATTTEKTAHQHDKPTTHWVERYWVERGSSKLWYYRYTWMEGRKLHRHYIGSVRSPKANMKKQAVEDAIRDGQSPQEIKQLIRALKN